MSRHRRLFSLCAAAACAAVASTAHAQVNLYWQGGTAALNGANWTDGTNPNLTPSAANDRLFLGANGTATHAAGDLSFGRLRVGHIDAGGGTLGPTGTGSLTVTGGSLSATGGAGGVDNSGLGVGFGASGSLTIDAATVTVNQLVNVGYGADSSVVGTLTVNTGGTLTVTAGNLNMGVASSGGTGGNGNLAVNGGTLNVTGTGADLSVGSSGGSHFTQTAGATTVTDQTNVGQGNADGSSFTLSGGTFNTRLFSAAGGTADNVSVTITGGTLATGAGLIVATAGGNNTTLSVSNNAVVNITNNLAIADQNGTADKTVFNLSGNATMTVGIDAYIGRGNSTNTTFNMTGGSLAITGSFLGGSAGNGTKTNSIVGNHSAGPITTGANFVLADNRGDMTYNLSGTGSITATGLVMVGRQGGAGVMNQAGGAVTAGNGVSVGNAVISTDPAVFATGTYNLSAGTLTANVVDPNATPALSIAPSGTGTLRVIGDDATIDVNGNMVVHTTPAADPAPAFVGTLAFQLEAGDAGLSMIDVSGNATFDAGTVLLLDFNSLTPAANSYNLLTATDVIDNGLTFSAPAGWNFQIISGGNGEILQAFAAAPPRIPGDTNGDGTVDLADLNNVLNNFGATGSSPGDDDGNGVVDLADLNRVLNNFGDTAAASALSVVPEPSLVAWGFVLLPLVRRRPNRR